MPTGDAYSSGHLVLSHFGTCMCSNVETNLSWTCLVSGLLNFEHPSVLLFCLSNVGQKSRSRSRDQNFSNHRKGLVIKNKLAKYESPMFNGAELKFPKCRSKVTVNVMCSKFMVKEEKSCHKEQTCQI